MSRDENGRFVKGESGNPNGRPPKGECLTDALRAKVNREELADLLIDLAKGGDLAAVKYVYDRIDGTPRQTIDTNIRQVPDVVGYEYDDFARAADTEDTDADSESEET